MKHKVELIDQTRGLSVLFIILIHIIRVSFISKPTAYSSDPFLFWLWSIGNLIVVPIVICSGFSLFSSEKIGLTFSEVFGFYKKRFKRLLLPYWIFCTIYFLFFFMIEKSSGITLSEHSLGYIVRSYLSVGGISIGWLIGLMIMLSLLYPFLSYLYEKKRKALLWIVLLYVLSFIMSRLFPMDIYSYPDIHFAWIPGIWFVLTFILGWSIILFIGFFVESLYNSHKLSRDELRLIFNIFFLFLLALGVFRLLSIDTNVYINKYPPSPLYLLGGILITFLIFKILFSYKYHIPESLRRILDFSSWNSFWIYLWSGISIPVVSYFFSFFGDVNLYLLWISQFVLNMSLISLLVRLQKKIIRIEIYLEKHHF